MCLRWPRQPLKRHQFAVAGMVSVPAALSCRTIKPQPRVVNGDFPLTNSLAVKKLQPVHLRNCVPDEIRRLQIAFMTFYIFFAVPARALQASAHAPFQRVKRELFPSQPERSPSNGSFVSSKFRLEACVDRTSVPPSFLAYTQTLEIVKPVRDSRGKKNQAEYFIGVCYSVVNLE